MTDWTETQDPYQVLGLAQGHETTEAELKKVRRHRSWHLCGSPASARADVVRCCYRHTEC